MSENVAQLHEGNVETEKPQDGLHEIIIEKPVVDIAQHEQIVEPV